MMKTAANFGQGQASFAAQALSVTGAGGELPLHETACCLLHYRSRIIRVSLLDVFSAFSGNFCFASGSFYHYIFALGCKNNCVYVIIIFTEECYGGRECENGLPDYRPDLSAAGLLGSNPSYQTIAARSSRLTGSARLYNFTDLVQLRVAHVLREKGISVQKLRKCLTYLKKHAPEVERPLAQLRLLTDGESVFVLTKEARVMVDTLRGGQLVWSLALGEIVAEVRGKVTALSARRTYKVATGGKNYTVTLEPDLEDGGYVAECPSLSGCMSQGETIQKPSP